MSELKRVLDFNETSDTAFTIHAINEHVSKVTRVEVIDSETGRVYSRTPCSAELDLQDGATTLKIFVDRKEI